MADSKAVVVCPKCGHRYENVILSSINVAASPELKEKARNGSIFISECPSCGETNLVKYPLLYHDPEQKFMLWLSPSEEEVARVKPALDAAPELASYSFRIVDSIGDFIEKLAIFEAGLDDVVIQMCKYVTEHEIGKEVSLRFFRMEGADNEMTFTYPEGGNMQMLSVGFNVYEDCRGIVQRNSSLSEAAKGLVRVDADWLGRFLR